MKISTTQYLFIVLFGLLLTQVSSHGHSHDHSDHGYECVHELKKKDQYEVIPLEDVDPESAANHRMLATPVYAPLRIFADYTYLNTTTAMKNRIKQVMDAAISYFNAALNVVRLTGITVSKIRTSTCGLKLPAYYFNGTIQADLALFVTSENTSDTSYVAWADACTILATTGRPIFGQVNFNVYSFSANFNDEELYRNVYIAMHEITHVLGFSSSFFYSYPNSTVGTKILDSGTLVFYLDTKPLTQMLRDHFNCPTLEGAFLENGGGSASFGSHFERKIFMNEMMTGSEIKDPRLSKFTLAALVGSGWYTANYNMADPIYWGQNKGCGFLNGDCVDRTTKKANYKEFCSNLTSYGCSGNRRYGGYCGTPSVATDPFLDPAFNYWGNNSIVDDFFADNCPYYMPFYSQDCENPAGQGILSGEFYGAGSKCFEGNLNPYGAMSKNFTFCLKYQCNLQPDGITYSLGVQFGASTIATCTQEGRIAVSGYQGNLICPDPQEFCGKTVKPFCLRGCMGRGTCGSNGVCQCNSGWRGLDCSIPV